MQNGQLCTKYKFYDACIWHRPRPDEEGAPYQLKLLGSILVLQDRNLNKLWQSETKSNPKGGPFHLVVSDKGDLEIRDQLQTVVYTTKFGANLLTSGQELPPLQNIESPNGNYRLHVTAYGALELQSYDGQNRFVSDMSRTSVLLPKCLNFIPYKTCRCSKQNDWNALF